MKKIPIIGVVIGAIAGLIFWRKKKAAKSDAEETATEAAEQEAQSTGDAASA